jgi:hypothetical protein
MSERASKVRREIAVGWWGDLAVESCLRCYSGSCDE